MIVDSSAAYAVVKRESGWEIFGNAMAKAGKIRISAASIVELGIILESRFGDLGREELDDWLTKTDVQIVSVTAEQAAVAREAFRRFGKGRHPAALNFGDCFSYALAKVTGEELLFRGRDFSQTDIVSALRA